MAGEVQGAVEPGALTHSISRAVCLSTPPTTVLVHLTGATQSWRERTHLVGTEGCVVVCGRLCAGPKKTVTLMVWSKGGVGVLVGEKIGLDTDIIAGEMDVLGDT